MKKLLLGLAFLSLTSLGYAQKNVDYSTVPSLVKEAKEKDNHKLADSLAQDYMNNYLFKLKEAQLLNKDNLLFISENMNSTDSRGFKLFFKQPNKINSVLGPNSAEYTIRKTIAKQFIPEIGQNSATVDWDGIEKTITAKFGAIGQEMVYGKRMGYYGYSVKNWNDFGKYYMLYFEKALKRPEYHINNASWLLFENVNDPKVLKFACEVVMKFAIGEWYQTDANAYDTFANLLYKTGKKDQAIEWEEKALKLAKGNEYLEKQLAVILEKMQKNERTWNETIVNP